MQPKNNVGGSNPQKETQQIIMEKLHTGVFSPIEQIVLKYLLTNKTDKTLEEAIGTMDPQAYIDTCEIIYAKFIALGIIK